MKKSVLLIAACFTFYVTCFSQTTDSVLSESRTTGEWQKNSLDIYTRDASCALVSALTLTWDAGTQSWVNAFLSAYSNGTGGVSEVFTQNWDAINNEWVNNSKSLFFPGNGGSKKRYILQTWDASSGTWINSYRIIEDLDGLGRTVTSEFDLYSNNEWQKIQRSLLSYDAENRVAQSIFQVWANNEWLNNGKTTNSYTSKGITYDYLWDNTNSVWTIFRRAYNDYIDNTALSTKLFGQIIAGTDWMNAFRSTSSYNSDNRLLSNLQQFWDANTLQWVNGGRIKSDYYENGSQHHFRFESWDASTSSWSYGFRTTGTDMSCLQSLQLLPVSAVNNRTVLLSQNNDGKNLLHRMPEAKAPSYKSFQRIFNPLAGDSKNVVYDITLNNGSKQYAFELVLSTAAKPKSISSVASDNAVATKQSSFAISPNPAKTYFNINLSAWKNAGDVMLKLSDVSGKLIMQQKMTAVTQRVNLPSLQKGIYIVTINSGKEIHTQKLVVE